MTANTLALWILCGIVGFVFGAAIVFGAFMWGQMLRRLDEERARTRIDVTPVSACTLEELQRAGFHPSPELLAAVERRRNR